MGAEPSSATTSGDARQTVKMGGNMRAPGNKKTRRSGLVSMWCGYTKYIVAGPAEALCSIRVCPLCCDTVSSDIAPHWSHSSEMLMPSCLGLGLPPIPESTANPLSPKVTLTPAVASSLRANTCACFWRRNSPPHEGQRSSALSARSLGKWTALGLFIVNITQLHEPNHSPVLDLLQRPYEIA